MVRTPSAKSSLPVPFSWCHHLLPSRVFGVTVPGGGLVDEEDRMGTHVRTRIPSPRRRSTIVCVSDEMTTLRIQAE